MAQHEELDVLGGGRTAHQQDNPSTCRKIKYSKRSDTPGSCPTSDHRWSATQSRVLAPRTIVAVVGARETRRGLPTCRRPPIIPLFVVGFLVMIAIRSSGVVPAVLLSFAQLLTALLFAAALFGLGSAVRLSALLRNGRSALLGALSTSFVGILGLGTLIAAQAL